ncbi:hypothetical protein [Thioalkalivibrio sp. ALE12]|uniref:hypothetical protein n=1 Tax=Thioalkalivibrio sp. ALE12 TaxID=1158170 RepID=UPI00036BAECC|nr:hypothetical protein [Thioalkalivibrio sp. ALE12]
MDLELALTIARILVMILIMVVGSLIADRYYDRADEADDAATGFRENLKGSAVFFSALALTGAFFVGSIMLQSAVLGGPLD